MVTLPFRLRVEPLPVVLDQQGHGRALIEQAEPDGMSLGVPDDVGQRFPGDPEQLAWYPAVQRHRGTRGHEPDLEPADALRPRRLGAQRGVQGPSVQRRRGESEQRAAGFDERFPGRLAGLPEMLRHVAVGLPGAVQVDPDAHQPLG